MKRVGLWFASTRHNSRDIAANRMSLRTNWNPIKKFIRKEEEKKKKQIAYVFSGVTEHPVVLESHTFSIQVKFVFWAKKYGNSQNRR